MNTPASRTIYLSVCARATHTYRQGESEREISIQIDGNTQIQPRILFQQRHTTYVETAEGIHNDQAERITRVKQDRMHQNTLWARKVHKHTDS